MNRVLATVGAVAIAVPVCLAAQAADADFDKIMRSYEAAFSRGDAAAIAGHYVEDAVRIAPNGEVQTGRAAIQKGHETAFAGPLKGAKIALTATETKQISPDVRVVAGTWQITGAAAGPLSGKYMNTLVRRDGQWKIAANTAMRPAEMPAPAPR